MMIRTIHRDSNGLYFKGEGFRFAVPAYGGYREGEKIKVVSVSVGSALARR